MAVIGTRGFSNDDANWKNLTTEAENRPNSQGGFEK
jgi:hypothetical protein